MGIKRPLGVTRPVKAEEPSAKFANKHLQGGVWPIDLDPTLGTEIPKRRPALVVSPDDMKQSLPRLIVAPLTTHGHALGCRPEVRFKGKRARILLDQIRCIDKSRPVSQMGRISTEIWKPVLLGMFS